MAPTSVKRTRSSLALYALTRSRISVSSSMDDTSSPKWSMFGVTMNSSFAGNR